MKDNFEGTQVQELMDELIKKIRSEIAERKVTSSEVANSIGMSPQSFSDVLSGHRGSLNQLVRILNGLGYTVEMKLKENP